MQFWFSLGIFIVYNLNLSIYQTLLFEATYKNEEINEAVLYREAMIIIKDIQKVSTVAIDTIFFSFSYEIKSNCFFNTLGER